MTERRCDKCEFWNVRVLNIAGEVSRGDCRLRPPEKVYDYNNLEASYAASFRWPSTYDTDWCGKFSRKDNDSAPRLFGERITDIPTERLTEHLATLGNKPINRVLIALINAELRSRPKPEGDAPCT